VTTVERSYTNNNYHITLEIDERYGRNYYTVQACPMIGEHLCGYPVRQMTYAMNEKSKAINTYNRYVKKYV
jgi:hypothetical protein